MDGKPWHCCCMWFLVVCCLSCVAGGLFVLFVCHFVCLVVVVRAWVLFVWLLLCAFLFCLFGCLFWWLHVVCSLCDSVCFVHHSFHCACDNINSDNINNDKHDKTDNNDSIHKNHSTNNDNDSEKAMMITTYSHSDKNTNDITMIRITMTST